MAGTVIILTKLWLKRRTALQLFYMLLAIVVLVSFFIFWESVAHVFRPRPHQVPQTIGLKFFQPDLLLPDLQENHITIGQSIFFHETLCYNDGSKSPRLNPRQACSIESAALHHPNKTVHVLISSPALRPRLNVDQNIAVKGLLNYENIQISHINFERYLKNTPTEHLIKPLKRSKYPVSHASDILRYTTLYKFKGTYLDLDVITLQSLQNYTNMVGAESSESLGAGVINFADDEVGWAVAEDCASEIQKTFDGSDWGKNGPGVLSRVLRRRCYQTNVLDMINADCSGFNVLPINKFYGYPYSNSALFFQPGKLPEMQKVLESSVVIHYWNKMSAKYSVTGQETEQVPFSYYAKLHCPKVYEVVNGAF